MTIVRMEDIKLLVVFISSFVYIGLTEYLIENQEIIKIISQIFVSILTAIYIVIRIYKNLKK